MILGAKLNKNSELQEGKQITPTAASVVFFTSHEDRLLQKPIIFENTYETFLRIKVFTDIYVHIHARVCVHAHACRLLCFIDVCLSATCLQRYRRSVVIFLLITHPSYLTRLRINKIVVFHI